MAFLIQSRSSCCLLQCALLKYKPVIIPPQHLWRHLFCPPATWPFRVHINMLFKAFQNLGYAVTHHTAQFPQISVRKPGGKPWRTTAGSGLHGPVPGGQEACTACQALPEETRAVELPARLQRAVPHTSLLLPKLQGQPCSSPHQQLWCWSEEWMQCCNRQQETARFLK